MSINLEPGFAPGELLQEWQDYGLIGIFNCVKCCEKMRIDKIPVVFNNRFPPVIGFH